MSTEDSSRQIDQRELEEEYEKIARNGLIYHTEKSKWEKVENFTLLAFIVSYLLGLGALLLLPKSEPVIGFELVSKFPYHFIALVGALILTVVSYAGQRIAKKKVRKIETDLGLQIEEELFLLSYETHEQLEAYLDKGNARRKPYFKERAIERAKELSDAIVRWKIGNVRLFTETIGNKVNLLKNNLKKLVLPNVSNSDEKTLKSISKIMTEFCGYLLSPSPKKIDTLDEIITSAQFQECTWLTRKEKMKGYFYSKPRGFRLVFAFCITAIVVTSVLFLDQSLGVALAVGVTCFWGSFTGFDKLFKVKEK